MANSSDTSNLKLVNETTDETNIETSKLPSSSIHHSDATVGDTEMDGRSIVDSFLTDDDGTSLLGDVPNPLYSQRNGATSSFSLSSMLSESTVDSVARHLEDGRQGRTITLSQLCDIIDECGSLERAHILSVECYRERSKLGILHRTLILHLHRHGRTDVWLRIDRRRAHNVSLLRFALRRGKTEANDVAQLAAQKSILLKRSDAIAESRIDFVLPPSLGAFRTCFLAIRAELLEYHVWPTFEQILFEGAPHETAEDLKQLSIINAQLKVQNSTDASHRFIRGLVYDMTAIHGILSSHIAKEQSRSQALKSAFAFEQALSQREYPAEALKVYETLAYPSDPVYARLRVLKLSRALYLIDASRHWWKLASQLVELANFGSTSHPALAHACLAEVRSILAEDPTRRLWVPHRRPIVQRRTGLVCTAAFSLDGQCIALGTEDGSISLWDALAGDNLEGPLRGHTARVQALAFSPNSQQLVSGSEDGTIRRWGGTSWEPVGEPLQHTSAKCINCVAFSPDGSLLASGSDDSTIQLWDASTSERLGEPLQGHWEWVWSLAFSPDGRRIVSGCADKTVRLWDVSTRRALGAPMEGHTETVWCVAFSPDGKLLVSGSWDSTLRRWDVNTGEPVGDAMKGHAQAVQCVAFSPDGKTIASGSDDDTIRLWDAITGESIGEPLVGHKNFVWSVAFSPDGRQIVSGSSDGTIRIWDSLDLDHWPDAK